MTIFFLLLTLLLLLEFLLRSREKKKRIRRMLGVGEEDLSERLVRCIKGAGWSKRLLERSAFSLAFLEWRFAGSSETQMVLLTLLLLGLCLLIFLVLLILGYGLFLSMLVLASVLVICLLILYMLYRRGKERFESALPQIYRLLSSRYLVSGDMLDSIRSLIPELAGGTRRLFENILQALQYNDLERRDERFLQMMKTVDLEYFTLLLYIVRQACDKGGKETILTQFVDLTEECLVEMQTRKDLKILSRSYQLLLLILGVLYLLVPSLNRSLMLAGSAEYYVSKCHVIFSGFFLLLLLMCCWLLQYMERTF